jgi:hypothetical protein
MGYLSADAVGSASAESAATAPGVPADAAPRAATRSRNAAPIRSSSVRPAPAMRRSSIGSGRPKVTAIGWILGDATRPRQQLERALHRCRDGRRLAAPQQLPPMPVRRRCNLPTGERVALGNQTCIWPALSTRRPASGKVRPARSERTNATSAPLRRHFGDIGDAAEDRLRFVGTPFCGRPTGGLPWRRRSRTGNRHDP